MRSPDGAAEEEVRMKRLATLSITAIMPIVLLPPVLLAVEPPHLTKKWLDNAEEVVEIVALAVESKEISKGRYPLELANVQARVARVVSSKMGLQPSQTIYLVYYVSRPTTNPHRWDRKRGVPPSPMPTPIPGPSSPALLRKGERYLAYVNKLKSPPRDDQVLIKQLDKAVCFEPAALGKSFVYLPAEAGSAKTTLSPIAHK
jgi:hypothetical protein